MQRQNVLFHKASFHFGKKPNVQLDFRTSSVAPSILPNRSHARFFSPTEKLPSSAKIAGSGYIRSSHAFRLAKINSVADEIQGKSSDEDDELCPVECVREFKTDEEFLRILARAKKTNSLVVVDFYRTACGSCKYIEQGFAKLCKGSGNQNAPVIFLKHNVIDEYDEQSEVAERLRIKAVPLFHFYKDGVLLEAFPTRDKERIIAAIIKHSSLAAQDI